MGRMKKAICVPYSVGQNEPSKPLNRVYELYDIVKVRNDQLKNLFIRHVLDGVAKKDIKVYEDEEGRYGDLIVEGPHDCFMYVTFVDES